MLTDDQVIELREAYGACSRRRGFAASRARALGVSPATISRVVHGKAYATVVPGVARRQHGSPSDLAKAAIRKALALVCGETERDVIGMRMQRRRPTKARSFAITVASHLLINRCLWSSIAAAVVIGVSHTSVISAARRAKLDATVPAKAEAMHAALIAGYGREWWSIDVRRAAA